MKNYYCFTFVTVLLSTLYINAEGQTHAQHFGFESKIDQDRAAIKSMQGCYDVTFNFAETFSYSDDSLYTPSEVKHMSALEWVEIIEDERDRISMQHLLIVNAQGEQQIVKHWRQDWLFENTDAYRFDHDNQWHYVSLPLQSVKGQWTQRVAQVDDTPRYEGSATWVHVDGKSSWENTTDAPLPRREHTTRKDYNVTVRTNHIIADQGQWIHDQDNDKVIRKEGESDILLAEEKGRNVYTKVDDQKCQSAQDWWAEHHVKWDEIRAEWNAKLEKKEDLDLSEKY